MSNDRRVRALIVVAIVIALLALVLQMRVVGKELTYEVPSGGLVFVDLKVTEEQLAKLYVIPASSVQKKYDVYLMTAASFNRLTQSLGTGDWPKAVKDTLYAWEDIYKIGRRRVDLPAGDYVLVLDNSVIGTVPTRPDELQLRLLIHGASDESPRTGFSGVCTKSQCPLITSHFSSSSTRKGFAFNFVFKWQEQVEEGYYRIMQDPDGAKGPAPFTTVLDQLDPADGSATLSVENIFESPQARYRLEFCNAEHCRPFKSLSIPSVRGQLLPERPLRFGHFGYGLAISGDGQTMAVGMPGKRGTTNGIEPSLEDSSGEVRVYRRVGDGWIEAAVLRGIDPTLKAAIGYTVALDEKGRTLVFDVQVPEGSGSGYVIFESRDTGWEKTAFIPAYAGSGKPGLALSGDGSVLALQARLPDRWGFGVFVFNKTPESAWQLISSFSPEPYTGSYFGKSIALDFRGRILAIGDPQDPSAARGINDLARMKTAGKETASSGAVHLYERLPDQWLHTFLKASNADAYDEFGTAVALSRDGKFLAVGTPGEGSSSRRIDSGQGDNSCRFCGAAYVFHKTSGEWRQQSYLKSQYNDYGDHFGESVAINTDGTRLLVGAPGTSYPATEASAHGGVFIYERKADKWALGKYWVSPDIKGGDDLGSSVAISNDGGYMLVSATDVEVDSVYGAGAVYMVPLAK